MMYLRYSGICFDMIISTRIEYAQQEDMSVRGAAPLRLREYDEKSADGALCASAVVGSSPRLPHATVLHDKTPIYADSRLQIFTLPPQDARHVI